MIRRLALVSLPAISCLMLSACGTTSPGANTDNDHVDDESICSLLYYEDVDGSGATPRRPWGAIAVGNNVPSVFSTSSSTPAELDADAAMAKELSAIAEIAPRKTRAVLARLARRISDQVNVRRSNGGSGLPIARTEWKPDLDSLHSGCAKIGHSNG